MEKATKKMFVRDVAVVLGFVVFLWVTMCFIMFSVLRVVGSSQTRGVVIVTGVAALMLATLSLLALISHLKHRREIYVEELLHSRADPGDSSHHASPEEAVRSGAEANKTFSSTFVKAFDVLFVMVLCFATLLGTMLLRGETVNRTDIYSVGTASALVTVVGFAVYFIYILTNSNNELRAMVNELYPEEGADGKPASAKERLG